MAKKRAKKIYEEEEETLKKRSINGLFKDKKEDELMGINTALEQEKEQQENTTDEEQLLQLQQEQLLKEQQEDAEKKAASKGIAIPKAIAVRDPRKNKDPLEGEDLGIDEDDFLLARKVRKEDLEAHNEVNEEGLLGSNIRRPRDFISIFSRGPSTDESPKIDSSFAILNNKFLRKEVAAIQLLHNYHSKDNKEKSNTLQIFRELYLEEDIIDEIKEDKKAYEDEDLIQIIMNRL
ncbi:MULTISPECIES: hypothetical protein [unclassified Aureispira]|uniref:hypothetical protein n=1 Tax=unclassified Aureispira TaxID=2649989 RepID=UPI0006989D58|nr:MULTISPECIES: hypothetical protein [unclassified Aureispira]WMX15813.1 hypothetical protein QP953_05370 [Aureispira sp. CCB-E]